MEFPSVVELNVGGSFYTTRLSTLRSDPDSMLFAMFSGRHPVDVDSRGRYFIDRDGRNFHHVLDFLRHGVLPSPHCVLSALSEAEYYQVGGLLTWCQQQPGVLCQELKKKAIQGIDDRNLEDFCRAILNVATDSVSQTNELHMTRCAGSSSAASVCVYRRPVLPNDDGVLTITLTVALLTGQSVELCSPKVDGGRLATSLTTSQVLHTSPSHAKGKKAHSLDARRPKKLCMSTRWAKVSSFQSAQPSDSNPTRKPNPTYIIGDVDQHEFAHLLERDSHPDILVQCHYHSSQMESPHCLDVMVAEANRQIQPQGFRLHYCQNHAKNFWMCSSCQNARLELHRLKLTMPLV